MAVASMLAALCGEVVCRFSQSSKGPTTNPLYVVHDPVLGWRYRRNAMAVHHSDDFSVSIHIDSEGRRVSAKSEPETAVETESKPLVLLGDSLAFGWGVEAEESFAGLLRAELSTPVLNMSVSGFGPGQELLELRRDVLPLTPSVVILTFCSNDLDEVLHETSYGRSKPRWALVDGKLTQVATPSPQSRWIEHSALLRAIHGQMQTWTQARPSEQELLQARNLVRHLHREMAADLSKIGASLLVLAWGETWLDQSTEVEGLHYLDLSDTLARASSGGNIVFPSDPHWNRRGHRAIAEALLGALRQPGLLPDLR